MLINLSEQIRECLQHAEDCARKAAGYADPKLKQDFFDLELHWRFLARSYEFRERQTDFSDETTRQIVNCQNPSGAKSPAGNRCSAVRGHL